MGSFLLLAVPITATRCHSCVQLKYTRYNVTMWPPISFEDLIVFSFPGRCTCAVFCSR